MNKEGFLRIVEATIAIVIIAGVLFLFFIESREAKKPDLSEKARDILDEISKNTSLRTKIVNYNTDPPDQIPAGLSNYVSNRIFEDYLAYEIRICEVDSACGQINYIPGDVYSAERIISSTINALGPKKIRLFIWEGQS